MITALQAAIIIIIAFLGIPAGKLIAMNTKSELKIGRRWFVMISGLCLVLLLVDLALIASGKISLENAVMYFAVLTFTFLLSIVSIKEGDKK